jgi:transcriptional regulator GlxA family with amidase domain
MADYTLNDISDPEIIVVSGGTKGTMMAAQDPRILSWLQKAHETSKWTTSVCTGSLILGAAGLLKGLQATTHWYAREFLEKFGAQYLSERVVRQGKIITAAGVSSGIDMALQLAQEVSDGEDHSIAYRIRSTTAFRFWIDRKSRAFNCGISETCSAGCVQVSFVRFKITTSLLPCE